MLAKKIQEIIGGDLFHIETVKSYPEDYHETTDVAKQELNNGVRPELSEGVSNMDSYTQVFLGYPNWWSTMPMAVYTFLEEYDFTGKTLIPFCTHEGSGLGHSVEDIMKLCPGAKVENPMAVYGSKVKDSSNQIEDRLTSYKK